LLKRPRGAMNYRLLPLIAIALALAYVNTYAKNILCFSHNVCYFRMGDRGSVIVEFLGALNLTKGLYKIAAALLQSNKPL